MHDADEISRLKVSIHGMEYVLRGYDSMLHLKSVAERVNQLMNEISNRAPQLGERHIAVLTAINLADELCKLQIEHRELLELLDGLTSVEVKG